MIPQLRDYQARAVTALYEWLGAHAGNPCIVAPTGSGKSWIIAALCEDILRQWPQSRIVVLSHVKELLEQDAEKIKLAWSDAPMGLYSAGLNRREIDVITVAGIQSIWQKGQILGRVDLIIVDECHLINHKDAGMYRTLIDGLKVTNPDLRIVGLTATPYRMNHGLITQGDALFDDLIEPVTIEELVTRGFLAPLRSKLPELVLDVDGVAKRGGEYVERDLQQAVDRSENNEAIVREVLARAGDRKAWLFFCTGVEHVRHMRDILRSHGVTSEMVVGDTPPAEREQILRDFKSGRVKALTNANVLTTGFDYPDIDLLAMCRPTLSPGLYCLDEQTEILTIDGWKRNVVLGETVAGFDVNTNEIKFVPVIDKIRRPLSSNEYFCSIKGPSVDIRVTNKHRMLYDTKNKTGWKFKEAEGISSLKSGCYLPTAGKSKFQGVPLTDAELIFIGWVMTDGSINKANNAIAISQGAHQPYLEEIENCIKQCGFKFTRTQKKRKAMFRSNSDYVLWTISKGKPRGRDKHLSGWGRLEPWLSKDISPLLFDMTDKQFAVMLEAINHGDGHKNPWRSYHIGKGNRTFIERLQIMAIQRGYRANVAVEKANKVRQSDLYILHIKKQTYVCIGSQHDKRPQWQKEPHSNEMCWCVENELGTLVTRRNGKVAIVGNCQMAGRGVRLKSQTDHCLVLDFAGNVATHGPITAVVPPRRGRQSDKKLTRECPECAEICSIRDRVCPACGYLFPKQERESKEMALRHKDDIMGLEPSESDITGWRWSVVNSRNTDIAMIRVDYMEEQGLFSSSKLSDYLCLLHGGFAAQKAYRLLVSLAKSSGVSLTVSSQDEIDEGVLQQIVDAMDKAPAPNKVTWRRDGKYYRVIERFWPEREADEWQNYQRVGMS